MENKQRQHIKSGAKWESIVGYSRAIRIGNTIEVSGTCALDEEGEPFAPGDAYEQTRRALAIIQSAIEALDGRMEDVVRTRIYVTDINLWKRVGEAHGEVFKDIRPVTTMVEVSRLISSEYLVEIEATAIITSAYHG